MNYENKKILKGLYHSGELIEFTSRKGDPFVRGSIVIETGENNLIPVQFIGKIGSKVEQSIRTFLSETKSVADCGRDQANYIEVKLAKLEENSFCVKGTSTIVEAFNIQGAFFSKVPQGQTANEFIIEGEIAAVIDEVVNDNPTGNVILKLISFGYQNRANVLNFTVPASNPAAISYVKNNCSAGQWITLKGETVIQEDIKEKKQKSAFGDDLITFEKTFVRKLVVNSATPPMETRISAEEKNRALSERENNIKEMKKRAMESGDAKLNKPTSASNFTL